MRLMRWLPMLMPIPVLFAAGCDSWLREIIREELQGPTRTLSKSAEEVSTRVSQLEAYLSYCSDEVKGLLGVVQKHCQSELVCKNADIEVEVLKIDPSREGRFLSLMQDRRHQAFYFTGGARDLSDLEKKQLRDLVRPAWLDDGLRKTRFLVVSHPENDTVAGLERAEKRGWKVIDEISQISRELIPVGATEAASVASASAPGSQPEVARASMSTASEEPAPSGEVRDSAKQMIRAGRVLHWIFPFSVRGEQIRQEDRPKLPTEKLSRSVWVYRVDC